MRDMLPFASLLRPLQLLRILTNTTGHKSRGLRLTDHGLHDPSLCKGRRHLVQGRI